MFLLASPDFPPQEPFDRLEIGQGSKFGKGQNDGFFSHLIITNG